MSTDKSLDQYRLVCGMPFPVHYTDLQCHLQLFAKTPKFEVEPKITIRGQEFIYDGSGRFRHSRIISEILYKRALEWHYWTETISRKSCESGYLAICGCGASSKSTTIADHALKFWMCAPLDSAVLIVSKTIDSSKKRIWREVSRFYSIFSHLVGGYRDAVIGSSPRPSICPIVGKDRKKDEAHGLYVVALHGKDLEKEKEFLKGFHPRRILVVADELDSLEEGGQALIEVFTDNLRTGTDEAQIIVLGNDPSLFNALGDVMQPELGKPVTLQHTEWKSAKGWDCLRLDAYDSPRIKNPKLIGLVTQDDIDQLVLRKGENSPSVWIQLHGIHPPEGSDNTVLSEAALLRFHCFDKVVWKSDFISFAALDPGFGGDPCIFRTFKRGNDTFGNLKVFLDEVIEIPIVGNDPLNPAEYQIDTKVQELCKARGIPPEEFVIGATGTGRGAAAVLQRNWSPRIILVEEGGACSDMPASQEDPRPANEVYDRKVTELWFSIREFTEADMIRGMDNKTAVQLQSRTYEEKGKKRVLQKKEEMLHSPNEADALGFGIHLLREKGVVAKIETTVKIDVQKTFQKVVESLDFDSSPDSYSDPLLDFVKEEFSF